MKRYLSIILMLCLVISIAVPAASAEGQKTEIVFWEMYGPNSGMHELVEQFNAQSDSVHATVEYYSSHDNLLQKLQVVAAAGSGVVPNVVLFDSIKVAAADQLLGCVDLTSYLDTDPDLSFDDFYPVYQTFSKSGDGRILSLHAWSNCLLLYWNKALFREAGLDPDVYPKSWAEQIEFGKKLTNPDKGVWGFLPFFVNNYADIEGPCWVWQSEMTAAGGHIWNEDYTKLTFKDDPASVDALNFYQDIFYDSQVATLSPPEKGFQNGLVAMQVDGTWQSNNYTAALGDDLGVGVWYGKDGNSAPNVGGEHFMIINSDKEHEDASWEFIKYFFQPEVNVVIAKNNGQVPTTKTVAESEAYADVLKIPAIAANLESVQYCITRAPRADYQIFSELTNKYVMLAMYQELTPEDAIAQLHDALVVAMDGDVG